MLAHRRNGREVVLDIINNREVVGIAHEQIIVHHAADDARNLWLNFWTDLLQRLGRTFEARLDDGNRIFSLVRWLSRYGVVKGSTQAVDVAPGTVLFLLHFLRCNVVRGTPKLVALALRG